MPSSLVRLTSTSAFCLIFKVLVHRGLVVMYVCSNDSSVYIYVCVHTLERDRKGLTEREREREDREDREVYGRVGGGVFTCCSCMRLKGEKQTLVLFVMVTMSP